MRRTLYWKRLLIVAVALLACTGAVLAVHRVQVRGQVTVYKEAAERAEAGIDGDAAKRAEVLDLYAKYLKFRPTDEAAHRRYAALLFEQLKADPKTADRAVAGAEGFLRAFPAHKDERRQLAEIYAQGGRYMNARQHVDMLLPPADAPEPGDLAVLELAAECDWALGKRAEALGHLDRAIKRHKAPVRVYRRALEFTHAQAGDPLRDAKVNGLLAVLREDDRFRNDPEARVAVIRFALFVGQDAAADAKYALETLPGGAENPEVLLAVAEARGAELKGAKEAEVPAKLAEMERLLRRARDKEPKNVAVGALLCEVLTRQGKRDEGLEALRAVAKLLDPKENDYALVADRLIDLGETDDSAKMVDVIAADDARKVLVPYFRGRLAVVKKDWGTALKLLEEAKPNLTRAPTFNKKLLTGLAACHATLLNPDRQLELSRQALAIDAEYPLAVLGEAEALARLQRVDEALSRYRRIVNQYRLEEYRTELVQLELYAALSQPGAAEERNWTRFNDAIDKTKLPLASRPAEMQVLCSSALAAQGKGAEGADELRAWLKANPKGAKADAVFVALSKFSGGTADAALAVLAEAKEKLGDSVNLRLARAGLLAASGTVPAPADLEALAAGLPNPNPGDQFKLWLGVGQAAGRIADLQPAPDRAAPYRDTALKCLRNAADLAPRDLASRTALLDNVLAANRADLVKQVLGEIEAIEGRGDGPFGAMGQIAVELPEVRKMPEPARGAAIERLRELARSAQRSRPAWGRVYVALAELDFAQGRNEDALGNYKKAIDNGERQEYVIRRTVDLFREKKQDDLAVGMLNKLRTEVRLPDDLERYRAIRDLLAAPEVPRNSKMTVDAIAPTDSKDYRMQLLRGALLATIREDGGSLAAFGRAVELNDQSPETWGSLVSQLVRVGDAAGAQKAVAQAAAKLAGAPAATPEARAELQIALGGLHEMIGDSKAALGHFEAAAKAAPLDLNATRQLILFHQRTGNLPRADQLLAAAAAAPAPDVARWARRHLALTVTAGPNAYNRRAEALALVEQNLKATPDDPEDVKARAVIQTVDPVSRDQGIRKLKEFGERGDLTPDEYYLLGRLAFDVGQYGEAEDHFKRAARIRPGVTAEHIAALVRVQVALSGVGKLDRAEATLERLKINNPGSWEAVREEARLLYRKSRDADAVADTSEAKKQLDRAREAVKKFKGWDESGTAIARTGPLFEEIGLPDEAAALYRKFLAASTDPGAHQPLAILHIRQKDSQRAIDLAFEREPKAPVLLTARLLTGAVRAKRPDLTVEAKVERWLDDALAKSASDPELESALIGAKAELADARGDYAAAIKEYERAIARFDQVRDPKSRKDVVVNNLCMLLALHQPQRANEAVKMMSDLIAVRGPVPAFLDTRAVAYLVSSRPELAIKDLEMALVQYDRATYHFHLAWAYDQNVLAEKRASAAGEVDKARRMGLTADDLHPIEFEKYKALQLKYPPRSQ